MSIHRQAIKSIVGPMNRPLARRRMARAIAATQPPYKIEIGAAGTKRPGWVGGDVTWRTQHFMDATVRWPFPDASASHVYADNVIEHIRMAPNRAFLREAHRVLRPSGRIRLATPDVGKLAELYMARNGEATKHLENAKAHGYEAHHSIDLLRIVFQDAGHHLGYLWDFESLEAELTDARFESVARCEAGQSSDPVLAGIDGREEAFEGTSIMLVVEAVRG